MANISDRLKASIGDGIVTSLFPVVRFFRDVGIGDSINNVEYNKTFNVSIKDVNLEAHQDQPYHRIHFLPLLTKAPTITSKADLINNKYTISSVTLSISNTKHDGIVFSDIVDKYLNAVCKIYFCASGLNHIDQCYLAYSGTIVRYKQSQTTLDLTIEDLTNQVLENLVPTSLIPENQGYREDKVGDPFPMVYGYVSKSPTLFRTGASGNSEEDESLNSNCLRYAVY